LQWYLDGDGDKWPQIFASKPVLHGEIVIVLSSHIMREWARRYMHSSVMVLDSTFGLNKHGYSVFAALAIGEASEGVPVAFFITKSETTESIISALKQFVEFLDTENSEDSVPCRPSTILTDDSSAEQAACSTVFPDAKQALCAYHVRAAIQKTLQQKLKGGGEQKKAAFAAMELFVSEIMYLPPQETLEATEVEAKSRFGVFKSKYGSPPKHGSVSKPVKVSPASYECF
jgi:hypothetical protein